MQLAMLLLMVGTAFIFAGRVHILAHSGIPPRMWIAMEAVLSSGPAFGWWCLSLGESSLALGLAFAWTFVGGLSLAAAHLFVKRCQDEVPNPSSPDESVPSEGETTNPMEKALLTFQRIDRTIDFDALGEEQEQIARTRRKRIASSG